jgi:hypothetical protein
MVPRRKEASSDDCAPAMMGYAQRHHVFRTRPQWRQLDLDGVEAIEEILAKRAAPYLLGDGEKENLAGSVGQARLAPR